jgi:hypothetical protein
MWTCRKCAAEVDDDFEVCWQCGTAADGTVDTAFRAEADGIVTAEDFEAERDARARGKMVIIASMLSGPEAHMLRSSLEAAGIQALVVDELTTGLIPVWGVTGGAKVLVLETQLEQALGKARQLLAKEPPAQRREPETGIRDPRDSVRDGGGGLFPEWP